MANYTGLSNLKNHVHRSGFDISKKRPFSAKVGEILPVYWDISMNGDKYTLKPEYFSRTRPVQTSAYTRIREYWDVYSVPVRLLWKSAPAALTQLGEQNPQQATSLGNWLVVNGGLPTFTLRDLGQALLSVNNFSEAYNPTAEQLETGTSRLKKSINQFGYSRGSCAYKLLSYLGYGNINYNSEFGNHFNWATTTQPINQVDVEWYTQRPLRNWRVNALPLLAYNKIYQDFFRWDQWEKPDVSTYNVDYYNGGTNSFFGELPAATDAYWENATMFDLRYCNYKKDLLMGVLPNSQFGDVSMVVSTPTTPNLSLTIPRGAIEGRITDQGGTEVSVGQSVVGGDLDYYLGSYYGYTLNVGDALVLESEEVNSSLDVSELRTAFSILQLRQQMSVQKWREITQSGNYDYVEQVEKHTGVKLSKALSNMCIWHGGMSRNLDISEVVNTNLADAEADIKGKGTGSGADTFTFETKEVSVVMVIYHAEPVLDYTLDAPDPQLFATNVQALPIPEYDNIGLESVSLLQMFNNYKMSEAVTNASTSPMLIGYQPRYYAWKTKMDNIVGAFATNLSDRTWVAPFDIRSVIKRLTYHSYELASNNPNEEPTTPIFVTRFEEAFNFNFFKIDPAILDDIFVQKADSTFETDQLLINCYIDCKVVRNLSRDGIQY